MQIKDSVSFKAKFVYNNASKYHKYHSSENKSEIANADAIKKFMLSDCGSEFLEREPEKDIFELRVYENEGKISSRLYHKIWTTNDYQKLVCSDEEIEKILRNKN